MTTPSPSSGPRPPTRSSTQSDDTANASPDQDTRRRRPYPENEACQASSCQHRRRAAVQPTDLAPRRGPPPPAPLLLFVIRPEWSYRLNADFEDHAEHEYMLYVAEHPELEAQPDPGTYGAHPASATTIWPDETAPPSPAPARTRLWARQGPHQAHEIDCHPQQEPGSQTHNLMPWRCGTTGTANVHGPMGPLIFLSARTCALGTGAGS